MKSLLLLVSLLLVLIVPAKVFAAEIPQISVPIKTIVRGDKGSTHKLASEEVSPELVGMTCEVKATAKNQGSVHPGNNIVVSSGESKVILEDVERKANELTEAEGSLKLEDEVLVTLVLGKDKVFSGGMNVELHCEEPKKIEVCRDGKIITIEESEKLSTDTSECTEKEEPKVLTATTLPKTGTGELVSIVLLTAIVGTLAGSILQRKK